MQEITVVCTIKRTFLYVIGNKILKEKRKALFLYFFRHTISTNFTHLLKNYINQIFLKLKR